MNKDELRYKYKIKRKYFQHSAREVADGVIADRFMSELGGYRSYLVYYSFGSEADTHALVGRLLDRGKSVYLPRVEGKEMVAVPYDGNEDNLVVGKLGVAEPVGQAYRGDVDVCVTPLLAVNGKGYRLGYGGGYYDRYFAAHGQTLKVGIGYFLQFTEEFVQEERDEPLDIFLCERGKINFGR